MDATLDFVRRARHAWSEFRQPNAPTGQQSGHPEDQHGNGNHWRPDPSLNNPNERSALENYRLLVGIHQDKSFSPPHGFLANRRPQLSIEHRPSPNLGIYSTVCDAEIKSKRQYKSQSRLINVCLGLQLVVAAALTALGAADGNRAAVTVFGAINTVIAGFLTYLKGSGLPNRLKYYQHEWAKVREYIEQRERDFSFGLLGHQHVLAEVETVREMYDNVRADIANNTPERFVGNPASKGTQSAFAASQLQRPAAVASMQSMEKQYLNAFDEKQAEANAAMDKAHDQAQGLFGKARGIKEMLENKIHDLGQMEKEIESDGRNMVAEKKQGIAAQVEHAVKEIAHLGKELETKATDVAADKQQQVSSAMASSTDAARATVAQQQQYATDALSAQRDAARGIIAQQQQYASDALSAQRDAARGAVTDTSNAASDAIARQQHEAQAAITRTSQAASDALNQHRENIAAAIAPRHDGIAPVPALPISRPREEHDA
ncbi:hypothetical protein CKM354_001176000 [Cercospora kikuchii]|uniref:SMODS and SLOG-associating 2TM effector domain-containing protein n=1 Tax=Cercospora kikuchii TaxID=84275 RepID=A0A9P3CXJ7_9PEZI|nr:uncharacterized protein CKM354_001176000 [Cercospora kikuchii]GIZ48710.1 hypothetical protein CKM354_001176000 [Cercospora kikuchii]